MLESSPVLEFLGRRVHLEFVGLNIIINIFSMKIYQ
jgi:hypothetical protein